MRLRIEGRCFCGETIRPACSEPTSPWRCPTPLSPLDAYGDDGVAQRRAITLSLSLGSAMGMVDLRVMSCFRAVSSCIDLCQKVPLKWGFTNSRCQAVPVDNGLFAFEVGVEVVGVRG